MLGQAIKGIPREELVIATKTDKRDGKSARAELDQSLESLGIEYLAVETVSPNPFVLICSGKLRPFFTGEAFVTSPSNP